MTIDPPYRHPSPKWALDLVRSANGRNRDRGESSATISLADIIALWTECHGCCAISGMQFNLQVVGDGQAKRPYAPSLDRIDRHVGYSSGNLRLVVSIADFAMNAWGDVPLHQLASAMHKKYGDPAPLSTPGPSDAHLEVLATLDSNQAETDVGTVAFPFRTDLHGPILNLLHDGSKSSRELEHALAHQFGITKKIRDAKQLNGTSAWRNLVSFALVDLGKNKCGTGKIELIEKRRAPDGGRMGIYKLTTN